VTHEFKPAVRENVSLLIALAGASGSGKTYSALRLAKGMAPGGTIFMIDTEARRGLHYADQFQFKHHDMRPPFGPPRFSELAELAETSGADVIIVDSFSHEYDGQGGVIEMADRLADGVPKAGVQFPRTKASKDQDWWKDWEVKPVESPGNWKEPKIVHRRMVNTFLQRRASMIFCLRADEKIEIVKEGGVTKVRSLGWTPICEKRFMYEMTASFTLTPDKPGRTSYNLPHKLQEQHRPMFPEGACIDETAGRALAEWARGGVIEPAPFVVALLAQGHEIAEKGTDMLKAFWGNLTPQEKQALGQAQLESWKRIAADAEHERA
jgi:hypothetical protein